MITTGTIKIKDSNKEWTLENVQDINGHPMLYDQLKPGLFAEQRGDKLYVQQVNPRMSEGGLPILETMIVDMGEDWIHSEVL